jgi:AAA+ ATPase superfamily predicted ATPase
VEGRALAEYYVALHNVVMQNDEALPFLDRLEELRRLDQVARSATGGLIVVWGRRRIGKTRLLLEWTRKHDGLYWVADASAAPVQRSFLAEAIAARFPGFADVIYPDWGGLLRRLVEAALSARWRGPVVIDELPYLAASSPEAPSVFQRWLDHEARRARLIVALAGSSQRMMQGLALSADAPLYGRARELLKLSPLPATYIVRALGLRDPTDAAAAYSFWGGIPRYWELAQPFGANLQEALQELVLSPLGPLHEEPLRLLLEEHPPAVSLRPILEVIGLGAHKVSEIGGRIGQPATALHRPLQRLIELELVVRETPFGEPEYATKRALYRIADPFCRFWYKTVAPNRGALAAGGRKTAKSILASVVPGIMAMGWEDLCRRAIPGLALGGKQWLPARRHWGGGGPEWDIVSASTDGSRLLLGEAKCAERAPDARGLRELVHRLTSRERPALRGRDPERVEYLLAFPKRPKRLPSLPVNVTIVDAGEVLAAQEANQEAG